MGKKIRAKFSHGLIEPLEKIKSPEGKEIIITISETPKKSKKHEVSEWSSLANSSFIKDWENKKDAIYDNWQEKYNVSTR